MEAVAHVDQPQQALTSNEVTGFKKGFSDTVNSSVFINGHALAVRSVTDRIFADVNLLQDSERMAELAAFEEENKEELSELIRAIDNAEVKKIVLEGGHIYADQDPDETHFHNFKMTGLLRDFLIKRGKNVLSLLFVDDFHPEVNSLDVDSYVAKAAEFAWPIDRIVMERDMVPLADIMIETLTKLGKVLQKDKGIVLNKGAHLKVPQDGRHSCVILDSALSILKYAELKADGIVNVLPAEKEWRSQQKNTRQILRAFLDRRKLPFFNFFITEDGKARAGSPFQYR